jgi:hypothetical protein
MRRTAAKTRCDLSNLSIRRFSAFTPGTRRIAAMRRTDASGQRERLCARTAVSFSAVADAQSTTASKMGHRHQRYRATWSSFS